MAARSNIAIADGEAAPVTHTFVPYGDVSEGLAKFLNRNTSVPAASETLTIHVKASSAKSEDLMVPGRVVSPHVVEMRIQYPATYTDSSTGLTLVDYVDLCVCSTRRHPRSTDQRGKNLRFLAFNALSNTHLSAAIDRSEPVW